MKAKLIEEREGVLLLTMPLYNNYALPKDCYAAVIYSEQLQNITVGYADGDYNKAIKIVQELWRGKFGKKPCEWDSNGGDNAECRIGNFARSPQITDRFELDGKEATIVVRKPMTIEDCYECFNKVLASR